MSLNGHAFIVGYLGEVLQTMDEACGEDLRQVRDNLASLGEIVKPNAFIELKGTLASLQHLKSTLPLSMHAQLLAHPIIYHDFLDRSRDSVRRQLATIDACAGLDDAALQSLTEGIWRWRDLSHHFSRVVCRALDERSPCRTWLHCGRLFGICLNGLRVDGKPALLRRLQRCVRELPRVVLDKYHVLKRFGEFEFGGSSVKRFLILHPDLERKHADSPKSAVADFEFVIRELFYRTMCLGLFVEVPFGTHDTAESDHPRLEAGGDVAADLKTSVERPKCKWEPETGRLFMNGECKKTFQASAVNQTLVLNAFQAADWAEFVDTPFIATVEQSRTLRDMNKWARKLGMEFQGTGRKTLTWVVLPSSHEG